MTAGDGKQRLTDVATVETLLRLVQSVPSPKAELIKPWLAKVGYWLNQNQRIDERQEKLSEQSMVEAIDFVVFLAAKEYVDEAAEGVAYLAGVEHTLNEWSSEADERACRDLSTLRSCTRSSSAIE